MSAKCYNLYIIYSIDHKNTQAIACLKTQGLIKTVITDQMSKKSLLEIPLVLKTLQIGFYNGE